MFGSCFMFPQLCRSGVIQHAASGGSIWATDASAWITAIATAGLLIGAIITAVYAVKAFGKQAQELEDQREVGALQAEDLRESLKERTRLRRIAEREQADAVNFAWWPASHVLIMGQDRSLPRTLGKVGTTAIVPVGGLEQMTVIAVGNASRRRILNAACRIEPSEGSGLTLAAERTGQLTDTSTSAHRAILNNPAEGSTVPLIRAGSQYGFLLKFDLEAHPGARLAARFTDDAGLHWQIDQDLHLQPLSNRDDW
jgi:hypothetical protein